MNNKDYLESTYKHLSKELNSASALTGLTDIIRTDELILAIPQMLFQSKIIEHLLFLTEEIETLKARVSKLDGRI